MPAPAPADPGDKDAPDGDGRRREPRDRDKLRDRDFGDDDFPGSDFSGGGAEDKILRDIYLQSGDQWDDEPFDPDTSPPDGDEAWLADLPGELRDEHMVAPWTGEGERMAAGFLHRAGGRRGVGFAAGGAADLLPPGPVLAGLIAEACEGGPGGLGESELVGVLCAARRLASWAAARELDAVITLARRRAGQAVDRKQPSLIDHVADEIAAALTLTGRAAGQVLDRAGGLARLDGTRAAQDAGIIDPPRAAVFADELSPLGDADARRAEAMVLPKAEGMTTAQLRRALRRAVLSIDPAADIRRRKKAARQDAGVHLWTESSGNCGLAGRELPPAEMIAADQRLTAKARWLQAGGVPGTLDYLRALAFAASLNDRPLITLLPPGTDISTLGQPPADPPAPAQPATGQPSADQPSTGQPTPGHSAPGEPSAGQPDPGRGAAPRDSRASGDDGPGADGPAGGPGPGRGPGPGGPSGPADGLPGLGGSSGLADGSPGLGGGQGWAPVITGNVNLTIVKYSSQVGS